MACFDPVQRQEPGPGLRRDDEVFGLVILPNRSAPSMARLRLREHSGETTTMRHSSLLLCLALAACSDAGGPTTFVPGEPITYPIYSQGVLDDLAERMVQMCQRDNDPNDPGCIARIKERSMSCRKGMPDVFADQASYREHAKTFMFCLDRA
jgi:hypothetical protein